jgi:uncharacterized membrane protein YheB (UPF0754 family)
MPVSPWHILLAAAVGSLIGGATNTLAILMLFRPYRERRLLGLRLPLTPGLIPKRRAAIARRLARTVSTHLITPEALGRAFATAEIRETVAARVQEHLSTTAHQPLSESAQGLFGEAWETLAERSCRRLERLLCDAAQSEEFAAGLTAFLETRLAELENARADDLIGADGAAALEELLQAWLRDAVQAPQTRAQLWRFLDEQLEAALARETSLRTVVGEPFLDQAEAWLAGAVVRRLPGFVDRVLSNPATINRLLDEVGSALGRRTLTRWFGPEPEEVVREILAKAEDLPAILNEPETQQAVREAVRELLDRAAGYTLGEVVQKLDAAEYVRLKARLQEYVGAAVLTEETAGRAVAAAAPLLRQALGVRLGDVSARLDEEDRAALRARLVRAAREALSDPATTRQLVDQLRPYIEQRLGRLHPAEVVSAGALAWVARLATDNVLALVQTHAPSVLERIDIAQMVEDRINDFSIPQLERIVRDSAGRELKAITLLGFLLGGLVGALQPFLAALFGP